MTRLIARCAPSLSAVPSSRHNCEDYAGKPSARPVIERTDRLGVSPKRLFATQLSRPKPPLSLSAFEQTDPMRTSAEGRSAFIAFRHAKIFRQSNRLPRPQIRGVPMRRAKS